MLLRLLIFLSLLSAGANTAAHASICAKYDEPITQSGFEAYAEEVKDLFPVKYRPVLDTLSFEVSDDARSQLYTGRIGNRYSIVISSAYLKSNCVLGHWAMMASAVSNGTNAAQDMAAQSVARACSASDIDRPRCVLGLLDRTLVDAQRQEQSKNFYAGAAPVFDQIMLSAFRFALAHEFSHVLNETDRTPFRALAKRDSELAADLQALVILASGRAWHVSDTLLFSGRQSFDALVAQEPEAIMPHDPSGCRAIRSNSIRAKMASDLVAIGEWRAKKDMSLAFSPIAMTGSALTGTLPLATSGCSAAMPPEVTPIFADVALLSQWVTVHPDVNDETDGLADLARMPLRSEFGHLLRNTMVSSNAFSPLFVILNKMVDERVGPADPAALAARAALTQGALKTGLLTGSEFRKMKNLQAVTRYLARPDGSSFSRNTDELKRDIQASARHSRSDPIDTLVEAYSRFLNGECDQGMTIIRGAMMGMLQPVREMQSLVRLSTTAKTPQQTKALDTNLQTLIDQMPKSDEKQIRACEGSRAKAKAHMIAIFGWRE